MKKYTQKAKDYFNRHPESKECHITSDGRVFHSNSTAQGFAGTLKDQEIESYNRDTVEKDSEESTSKNEAEKTQKLQELAELELISANYNEMKALAKYFDVKTEGQKADAFITALTEFKATLNQ